MSKEVKLEMLWEELEKNRVYCGWQFTVPDEINKNEIFELRKITDEKIELKKGASRQLHETHPEFKLEIEGIGKDERCSWCRYFRNSLESLTTKKGFEFVQDGSCKFG